jgi:hypothetical protein
MAFFKDAGHQVPPLDSYPKGKNNNPKYIIESNNATSNKNKSYIEHTCKTCKNKHQAYHA